MHTRRVGEQRAMERDEEEEEEEEEVEREQEGDDEQEVHVNLNRVDFDFALSGSPAGVPETTFSFLLDATRLAHRGYPLHHLRHLHRPQAEWLLKAVDTPVRPDGNVKAREKKQALQVLAQLVG